jgi:hypothetical protein
MTPSVRLASGAAVAAAATLGLSGVAGASAGQLSFQKTYPIASRLCANIGRGAGPKRLRHSAAQVLSDCSTLQNTFNGARVSVLASEAAIAHEVATDRAATGLACAGPLAHRVSCTRARVKQRKQLGALGRQRVHAARAYYATVETARIGFWTQIHALPGGAGLHPDASIHEQNS